VADTTVGYQFEALSRHEEDHWLVEGLRSGEETAYEALLTRYEQPIYNLISRLVDEPADAADVLQDVFIKVFRKVGSFRGESSFKTWLYRIAVNEARNQRRWFTRHRGKEVGLDPLPGESQGFQDWLEDSGPSPFDITLDHETHGLIEEALKAVSPSFRAALVLRDVEGQSYEEIAEILSISLGTVKSRIMRGREALRRSLTEKLGAKAPALRRPAVVPAL